MSNINEKIKSKQTRMVVLLLGGIIAVALFVVFLQKQNSESLAPKIPQKDTFVTEKYSAIGANINEQQIWMAESSNEIDKLKKENTQLSKDLSEVQKTISAEIRDAISRTKTEIAEDIKKTAIQEREAQKKQTRDEKQAQAKAAQPMSLPSNLTEFTPPFSGAGTTTALNPPMKPEGITVTNRFYDNPDLSGYQGQDLVKAPVPALASIDFDFPEPEVVEELAEDGKPKRKTFKDKGEANVEKQAESKYTPVEKNSRNYIPAGTFIRAIVLGALDAPTGGQSQSNPHPVLLELDGLAQLPNDIKSDLKKCRIIAAGHGDISSERALIRLETMSCIDKNDVVHERSVKGYVYGEDGKNGLRGRIVTKQGQLLANSLLAGIGAGIGQAFKEQATTYSTTPLGTTQSIDPGQIGAAGLGEGVGGALDRLSKYYISLAEQMFPIIEIDAGRAVDVVLTSGFMIDSAVNPDAPQEAGLSSGIPGMVAQGQNVVKQTQELFNVNQGTNR